MNPAPTKDTIYVDIDDEITGIIDKVNASPARIVALVLPKRATVFQSVVNMKLLKRRADNAKKQLVLITTESGLLPLAGAVGLPVASTLQSKPEVPTAPDMTDLPEDIDEERVEDTAPPEDFDSKKQAAKPIGDLAGPAAGALSQMPEETIELDDAEVPSASAPAVAPAATKAEKKARKKLSIPNFDKFRLRLVLAGLAVIVLIAGLWLVLTVLPKATIDVKTNANNVNSQLALNLNTGASSLDTANDTVPAQTQQQQKTYTEQVPATGQKNKGDKATGSITMTATECGAGATTPSSVPAGTGVSTNGLTYITQQATSFGFNNIGADGCAHFNGNSPASITAQTGGAQYNQSGSTSFSVAGRSDVSASGSASGGTDNIVTVVSQSDVDGAQKKLSSNINDADSIKQKLEDSLKGNSLFPITATFTKDASSVNLSNNVGDTADNVTVTENITYRMYGVKKSYLHTLVAKSVDGQIDTKKQSILDDGIDSADFSVSSKPSSSSAQVSMQVTSIAGPHLDVNSLKSQIAGKKSGDVQNIIKSNPGVTDVKVHFSPFWVSSTPKKTSKITINFEKPPASKNANSN